MALDNLLPGQQQQSSGSVPKNPNVDQAVRLLNFKTLPYDAANKIPQSMPREQIYPAFSPGAMDQIATQMMAGFGTGAQQAGAETNPFIPYLQQMFQDTRTTNLFEPILQTYNSLLKTGADAVKKNGKKAADVAGNLATPNPFQQYGYSTGSDYLDKLFGIQRNIPTPAPSTPGDPTVPPVVTDPTKPPKPNKPPKTGGGGTMATALGVSGWPNRNAYDERNRFNFGGGL